MGCNCGQKKQNFQKTVQAAQPQNGQSSRFQNIIDTPDNLLSPKQLHIKRRHFRILARQKRIARRIALAERLKQAELSKQASQNNFPAN